MAVFVPVLCGEQLGSKRSALGPCGLISSQTSQAWQGVGDVLGLGGNDEQREKDQPQGSPHPAKPGEDCGPTNARGGKVLILIPN